MISIIMLISLDVVANMKETDLTLSVNGVTLRHFQDTRWMDDLLEFIQEPDVVCVNLIHVKFIIVINADVNLYIKCLQKTFVELPSQFIKLSVTVNDSSVDFNPNDIPGSIVMVLDSLKVYFIK